VQALREVKARRFVTDGELVVPDNGGLAFDKLLQRIHPAASRIKRLSTETPAQLILFDLLVDASGRLLTDRPFHERRKALEEFAAEYLPDSGGIRLSPITDQLSEAKRWFHEMAGGLDGIVAKESTETYRSGTRAGMLKIKNLRTADCVIGGFRYGQKNRLVGSLLLGLYDDEGLLHHVGFTSAISAVEKPELTAKLEQLVQPPGFTGSAPGGPSRWATERSAEWQPLKPALVIEVRYDHFTGGRFRHGTQLLRWRPDKRPDQCRMSQVIRESRSPLDLLQR
jgi:ATP-dependent DNA ligase